MCQPLSGGGEVGSRLHACVSLHFLPSPPRVLEAGAAPVFLPQRFFLALKGLQFRQALDSRSSVSGSCVSGGLVSEGPGFSGVMVSRSWLSGGLLSLRALALRILVQTGLVFQTRTHVGLCQWAPNNFGQRSRSNAFFKGGFVEDPPESIF